MKLNYVINKKKFEIVLLDNTELLYNYLNEMGIIERIKGISQLGTIKVPKRLRKSKFDYIMYQLYLISILSGESVRSKLKISTGNTMRRIEGTSFTIAETLQMLVLLNGVGHFNTTFTASKAVIQLCNESLEFKENLLRCFNDEEDMALVQNIIEKNDYMHFHLINSLIILNRLTETKHIKFAKEIIHSYLGICKFDDDKWKYVMNIFKVIRNISFNSIDLQVADLPYSINIHEKNQILRLLEEGLSEYNDNTPTYNLISSVTKLLDDTLYYSSDMVINQQSVTDKIVRKVLSLEIQCDYYSSYFFNNDSLLNNAPKNSKSFDNENYLKLTLIKEKCQKLYKELKSIEYVRCGYYDRGSLEQTIILSIDIKNENCCPEYVAFRVLSSVLKHLREIDNIQCNDKRFLLVTKYFLKYLLHASNIKIDGTLDPDKCVICVMGSKQRIIQLPKNITNQNDDIVHEVEFLKTRLKEDDKNDLTISIPASIKTISNSEEKSEHEFDGLIIFPNRKTKQIVFLEAKNRRHRCGRKSAANCLIEKLDDNGITYNRDNIIEIERDAYMYYSVPKVRNNN